MEPKFVVIKPGDHNPTCLVKTTFLTRPATRQFKHSNKQKQIQNFQSVAPKTTEFTTNL